jgi:hypothetical protein
MDKMTLRDHFALEFAKVLITTGMVHRVAVIQAISLADDLIERLTFSE